MSICGKAGHDEDEAWSGRKWHAVNEWRGCSVAWTDTRGRLEAFAAIDALFNTTMINVQLREQRSRLGVLMKPM